MVCDVGCVGKEKAGSAVERVSLSVCGLPKTQQVYLHITLWNLRSLLFFSFPLLTESSIRINLSSKAGDLLVYRGMESL